MPLLDFIARSRRLCPALLIALALSCKGDTTTVDPSVGEQTIECPRFNNWPGCALWPTDDGHAWQFEVSVQQWNRSAFDTLYASIDDIPPLPDLDMLIASFEMPAYEVEPDSTYGYSFDMSLRGFRVTPEGNARFLVSSTTPTGMQQPTVFGGPGSRLLVITTEHIGIYYPEPPSFSPLLEETLDAGHEFERQVIPQLAPDVVLHVRVLGRRSVTVPSGTYADALEVFYVLDAGPSEVVDSNGLPRGFIRTYRILSIVFAPDVGPVLYRERISSSPSILLSDPPHPRTQDWGMAHRGP